VRLPDPDELALQICETSPCMGLWAYMDMHRQPWHCQGPLFCQLYLNHLMSWSEPKKH
jgi:hypothetical protein